MYAYSDKLMPGIGLLRTSQAYVALQINPVSAPVLVPAQFLDMNSRPSWNDNPPCIGVNVSCLFRHTEIHT